MVDQRELILARLFAIMSSVSNITTVVRNIDEMPESGRPCLILIDGDETRADGSRGIGMQPIIMSMSPHIAIGVSAAPEELGPSINTIRRQLLFKILSDLALATILGTNGKITYEGLAGKLSQGSLMASDMELQFSIEYRLVPSDLA